MYSHGLLTTVSSAFQRVLRVKNVTQCASLEENGLFLVLADNVSTLVLIHDDVFDQRAFKVLVAYDIKALLPTTVGSPEFPKVQEIAQKVTTFHVGSICDRTVLVYLKASSVSFDPNQSSPGSTKWPTAEHNMYRSRASFYSRRSGRRFAPQPRLVPEGASA